MYLNIVRWKKSADKTIEAYEGYTYSNSVTEIVNRTAYGVGNDGFWIHSVHRFPLSEERWGFETHQFSGRVKPNTTKWNEFDDIISIIARHEWFDSQNISDSIKKLKEYYYIITDSEENVFGNFEDYLYEAIDLFIYDQKSEVIFEFFNFLNKNEKEDMAFNLISKLFNEFCNYRYYEYGEYYNCFKDKDTEEMIWDDVDDCAIHMRSILGVLVTLQTQQKLTQLLTKDQINNILSNIFNDNYSHFSRSYRELIWEDVVKCVQEVYSQERKEINARNNNFLLAFGEFARTATPEHKEKMAEKLKSFSSSRSNEVEKKG